MTAAMGSPPTKANATRERGEGASKNSDSDILHHPDKSIKLELHPLCKLFPRMSGYELDCLSLDIRENKLREPITTYQGMILDGGNRYAACQAAGVAPNLKEFEGDDITAFVLSANFHRRHLLISQHAAIVASVQDWVKAHVHGGTGANQHTKNVQSAPESTYLDTTKTRCALSGASVATQRRADAVAKASPELAQQVARGEVKLQKAVAQVAPQLASKSKKPSAHWSTCPEAPADDSLAIELEMQNDALAALNEENESLRNQLAAKFFTGSDEEKSELLNRLNFLTEENRKLEILNRGLIKSRDRVMTENVSLRKQLTFNAKKLKARA